MAALSTPDPKADARGERPAERLRLLRPLGAQSVPAWAALDATVEGSGRLVVAERAQRRAFDDADIADWIRDARRLEALDHPNVARVRDVLIRSDEVLVVTDYIDGVRWREVAAATPPPPLEISLRVFVDVLAGLNALHNLRDAKREPLKLVHGALTPENLIVGLDGVTRLLGAARPRAAPIRAGGSAYLAPEVLLEDDTADAKADTYGVGVMLWEALSGEPFLPGLQPAAIVAHLLSGRAPPVTVPASLPWAAPLADVVKRAMSADPGKRFGSASAMAAELRRIAGAKLPAPGRVATLVRAAFGEAVRARREDLERGVVQAPSEAEDAWATISVELPIEVADLPAEEASQTAPTVPPPAPGPTPAPPPGSTPATLGRAPSASAPFEARPATPVALALPPTVPAFVPQPLSPPRAPSFPEATTAVPIALTVPAVATPIAIATPIVLAVTSGRPSAVRFGLVGLALLAIAAATWWLAAGSSGGPRPAPHAVTEPSTVAPTVERPRPPPQAAAGSSASLRSTPNENAVTNPLSPVASITPPDAPPVAAPAARPYVAPTSPVAPRIATPPTWAKPRPTVTRPGYDPQGI